MEETPNAVLNGLSQEARRNLVQTASLTPRDKENAGANITRHSQSATVDQPKTSTTSASTTTPAAPPPARTPARSRLPSFFSTATTPSPASASAKSVSAFKESSSATSTQQQPKQLRHPSPATTISTPAPAFQSLSAQKSPPGTSQVLRKHFQSLGFATPPGKLAQLHQQRLLSSGAVRLTPNTRKKAHTGTQSMNTSRRVGVDGTHYTPSKELLKSTASSRNHRVLGLQDVSMEHPAEEMMHANELELQQRQQLNPAQTGLESTMDDETSTVASAATMDDASFDMSLPSMNNQPYLPSSIYPSSVLPAPHSPLTPRMGCLNPVALTLLNDGQEDYNYLLTQDALCPIPKVEDTMDPAVVSSHQQANTSMSSSSSTSSSSFCLSPTQSFGQSPAEVRGTLSQKVRLTLARPVAILARAGRISPSPPSSQPRLAMRPQPKHVR